MLSRPENTTSNPGVYIFKNKEKPIYIGKAGNLKNRLSSYWLKNANNKQKSLVREADELEIMETPSEIEALIKEAEMIKKNLPRYNVLMRDDKSYFYVSFSREKYPRVFVTHRPFAEIKDKKSKIPIRGGDVSYRKNKKEIGKYIYIGPFTSGGALKTTLRFLRSLFPFCTCLKPHIRPCLNSQIGRCLGFCCVKEKSDSKSAVKNYGQYEKNIKAIRNILRGKKKNVLNKLKKEMKGNAQKGEFEKAAETRDKIFSLENILSHRLVFERNGRENFGKNKYPEYRWQKTEMSLKVIINTKQDVRRVEGYDISNISGTAATGSMVVFKDGIPEKKSYRKFKIKTVKQISDTDMMKEILSRRMKHREWIFPQLMLLDGGRGQLNAAISILNNFKNIKGKVAVAALAKKNEELYLPGREIPLLTDDLPPDTKLFLQHVRNESHRFAKKYHHKLRAEELRYG